MLRREDDGQDARDLVEVERPLARLRPGAVEPLEDIDVHPGRLNRRRELPQGAAAGQRVQERSRVARAFDRVTEVVGEPFGPAALAENRGQFPGLHGRVEVGFGPEADRAVEAFNRLGVPPEPGEAEGLVIGRVGIGGIGVRQRREGRGGLGKVRQVPAREGGVPSPATSRVLGVPKSILLAGRGGQLGRVGQPVEGLARGRLLGIDPERSLPRRPRGERALVLQVVPTLVDEGKCVRCRGHRKGPGKAVTGRG